MASRAEGALGEGLAAFLFLIEKFLLNQPTYSLPVGK